MLDPIMAEALLAKDIDEAWLVFGQIAAEEEADDYSDAMVSMERTEANGFALGLERAYYILFNKHYEGGSHGE